MLTLEYRKERWAGGKSGIKMKRNIGNKTEQPSCSRFWSIPLLNLPFSDTLLRSGWQSGSWVRYTCELGRSLVSNATYQRFCQRQYREIWPSSYVWCDQPGCVSVASYYRWDRKDAPGHVHHHSALARHSAAALGRGAGVYRSNLSSVASVKANTNTKVNAFLEHFVQHAPVDMSRQLSNKDYLCLSSLREPVLGMKHNKITTQSAFVFSCWLSLKH